MWHLPYLGIKHDYSNTNCITLVKSIYEAELNFYEFDTIFNNIGVPKGPPTDKKRWVFRITVDQIEGQALKFFKKVNLTDIKEFDLLIFKLNEIRPSHFGVYVTSNKFLHSEEGKYSCLSELDDFYRKRLSSVWRVYQKNT